MTSKLSYRQGRNVAFGENEIQNHLNPKQKKKKKNTEKKEEFKTFNINTNLNFVHTWYVYLTVENDYYKDEKEKSSNTLSLKKNIRFSKKKKKRVAMFFIIDFLILHLKKKNQKWFFLVESALKITFLSYRVKHKICVHSAF